MEQDNKKEEEKMADFLHSYSYGIQWEEEFYPKLAQVLWGDTRPIFADTDEMEWKIMTKIADEQRKESERQLLAEKKERLENEYQEKLLEKFIDQTFVGTTAAEKKFIKTKISELKAETSPYYLRDEIEDFLSGGLAEIRKQMSFTNGPWEKAGKVWKYTWAVIMGFIEIFVLLAIINTADTKAASLIILGLSMIYLQVKGMGYRMAFLYPRVLGGLNEEFVQIRKLLKDKNIASRDELSKLAKTIKVQEAKSYIDIAFLFLMNVIVLWNLVLVVLG
ncbi:hypothetical protein A3E97_03935 [Candidatus Uhrbacteria bacterium RIFCSPHIGHO2_12_FULL_47_12]|uniref:Uncharacterized protein n=1 Tax=Candidatus Uhrbacteria bacterium RIFCSPLOWO2_02_FULL_48_18 TaxID=1802408 RepID=A0A1F7V9H6_9BACT|nr:MAG: hypothetical protein A3E97_03935 [Candidatus Uhrbacteria bacterium RIFCSPHIGHO2_12_FULL_47_12]OGL81937.1 MAG: hypothetical protein A3B20_02540 [Candidatus Uhrbacteria bacterium RIFCSPLOWO2_01_FULL_47_17]OGL87101.1 MAG: hypothetical protein A3I41_04135 [Candidatus Uhrbacteria bacterium RIFCSPLOWO2_02_FULL_48_18]OGL93684.1 MAG: hypothetical protein A3H12_03480 [Candidatus Uhrbacteria bacterium RIFCSPLOWO2_12_FULL_47_9]